jgi:hypothetical protein
MKMVNKRIENLRVNCFKSDSNLEINYYGTVSLN